MGMGVGVLSEQQTAEIRQIVGTIGERWDLNAQDREPVVERAPKPTASLNIVEVRQGSGTQSRGFVIRARLPSRHCRSRWPYSSSRSRSETSSVPPRALSAAKDQFSGNEVAKDDTSTIGLWARGDSACSERARKFRPLPLGPTSSTGRSTAAVAAARNRPSSRRMA